MFEDHNFCYENPKKLTNGTNCWVKFANLFFNVFLLQFCLSFLRWTRFLSNCFIVFIVRNSETMPRRKDTRSYWMLLVVVKFLPIIPYWSNSFKTSPTSTLKPRKSKMLSFHPIMLVSLFLYSDHNIWNSQTLLKRFSGMALSGFLQQT